MEPHACPGCELQVNTQMVTEAVSSMLSLDTPQELQNQDGDCGKAMEVHDQTDNKSESKTLWKSTIPKKVRTTADSGNEEVIGAASKEVDGSGKG